MRRHGNITRPSAFLAIALGLATMLVAVPLTAVTTSTTLYKDIPSLQSTPLQSGPAAPNDPSRQNPDAQPGEGIVFIAPPPETIPFFETLSKLRPGFAMGVDHPPKMIL